MPHFYNYKKGLQSHKALQVDTIKARNMHRSVTKAVNMNVIRRSSHLEQTSLYGNSRNMATIRAYKFKNKAATDFANDGSGKHAHICKEICAQTDCANKKCNTLCDIFVNMNVLGHNTHKPPIGRICKYIADYDANGVQNSQYYVKSNIEKIVDAKELQNYNQKEVKTDPKQSTFVNSTPEISNKYDVD